MRSPIVQAAEPYRVDPEDEKREVHSETRGVEEEEQRNPSLEIRRHNASTSQHQDLEKGERPASLRLTRTVSTRLSRVASRITNRDIIDPGPPPGRSTSTPTISQIADFSQMAASKPGPK